MAENRKDILLRAAYDLIKRSSMNHYVKSATDVTVWYDDAECDGYCLMEDISTELGLEDDEAPLPIVRHPDDIDEAKRWLEARGTR